jgi:AcrR family transcriptional regulator
MADSGAGRPNQKSQTRKDLLRAASRLMKDGNCPTFEDVAEEALVSRATAYRYFSGLEALLVEAALDVAMPDAEALFAGEDPADVVARLRRVHRAVHDMLDANEPALRTMLIHSLQQALDGSTVQARQNRRTPLIEAALAPAKDAFAPPSLDRLIKALALIIGTESMVAFKDVVQIDNAEADAIRDWMIGALVEASKH